MAAAACPIKGNVFQRRNWTSHNGCCFVSWHSHRRMQAKTQVLAFFWKRPVCFGPVRFAPCIDYNTGTQLAVAKKTGFGCTTAWSCRGAIFLQQSRKTCAGKTLFTMEQQCFSTAELMEEWPGRISYWRSHRETTSHLVLYHPISTAGTVRVPRTTEGTSNFLSLRCSNSVVHSIPRPVCHWRKVKGVDKWGELLRVASACIGLMLLKFGVLVLWW